MSGLQAFYLTGAILLLALAIFLYPTLKDQYNRKNDRKKKNRE